MAKVKVTVVKCDKCGTEDADLEKFLHVTVVTIPADGKKFKLVSSRDLCIESCVGAPGVNRDQ